MSRSVEDQRRGDDEGKQQSGPGFTGDKRLFFSSTPQYIDNGENPAESSAHENVPARDNCVDANKEQPHSQYSVVLFV